MTIAAARNFQLALLGDDQFQRELSDMSNPDARLLLNDWAEQFSEDEFEQAYRALVEEYQTDGRIRELDTLRLYWQLLCCHH